MPQVCIDRRAENPVAANAPFDGEFIAIMNAATFEVRPEPEHTVLTVASDSPATIRFQKTQIQGDFGARSVFKSPPNDELDHAWDSILMGIRTNPALFLK